MKLFDKPLDKSIFTSIGALSIVIVIFERKIILSILVINIHSILLFIASLGLLWLIQKKVLAGRVKVKLGTFLMCLSIVAVMVVFLVQNTIVWGKQRVGEEIKLDTIYLTTAYNCGIALGIVTDAEIEHAFIERFRLSAYIVEPYLDHMALFYRRIGSSEGIKLWNAILNMKNSNVLIALVQNLNVEAANQIEPTDRLIGVMEKFNKEIAAKAGKVREDICSEQFKQAMKNRTGG